MNFIIIGDRFQKRMKSKGCVGLIKVNHTTLIEHQYNTIKKAFPEAHIIYIYGFDSKRFNGFIDKQKDNFKDLVTIHNPNHSSTNNAYSLSLAKNHLSNGCCILFGDNILHKKTFDRFNPSLGSQIFISPKQKNKLGCIVNNDNKIENIAYDLDNYLSEIYYISPHHANILQQMINDYRVDNWFIFELINKLIHMNHIIFPFFISHHSKYLTA